MSTKLTDEFTAIGTLAAVLVALGVAAGPLVWRRLTLPRLKVTVGRQEPHSVLAWDFPLSKESARVQLRFRVMNAARRGQAVIPAGLSDFATFVLWDVYNQHLTALPAAFRTRYPRPKRLSSVFRSS
jgi:hypothetical protein